MYVSKVIQFVLFQLQLNIGEDEWKKLVQELQDVEKRTQPEEKKFEDVE